MKIIALNGPPRAGKDTAADAILRTCRAFEMRKAMQEGREDYGVAALERRYIKFGMSYPLKQAVHTAYGLTAKHDAFEQVKDQPRPEFFGATPRASYIQFSEGHAKPLHGPEFFGELWLRTMDRDHEETDVVVVPDAGFAAEWRPIIRRVGLENILLFCVHAEGRGKNFDGDSRSYIELPGVQTFDIHNDDESPEGRFAYIRKIVGRACGWLGMEVV